MAVCKVNYNIWNNLKEFSVAGWQFGVKGGTYKKIPQFFQLNIEFCYFYRWFTHLLTTRSPCYYFVI